MLSCHDGYPIDLSRLHWPIKIQETTVKRPWKNAYTQRRQLHYNEISACVLFGLIPNLPYPCLCVFPILVKQLLSFSIAFQLVQRNYKPIGYFCPNRPGKESPEGIYSHEVVRQPCLYFKYSECVFTSDQCIASVGHGIVITTFVFCGVQFTHSYPNFIGGSV